MPGSSLGGGPGGTGWPERWLDPPSQRRRAPWERMPVISVQAAGFVAGQLRDALQGLGMAAQGPAPEVAGLVGAALDDLRRSADMLARLAGDGTRLPEGSCSFGRVVEDVHAIGLPGGVRPRLGRCEGDARVAVSEPVAREVVRRALTGAASLRRSGAQWSAVVRADRRMPRLDVTSESWRVPSRILHVLTGRAPSAAPGADLAGLGLDAWELTVAAVMCRAHRGRLRFRPAPGGRWMLRVELPRAEPADAPAPPRHPLP